MTLGVALFVLTCCVLRDHRVLQRFTYTSGLAAILLLLLPLVPGIGTEINGARIWIHVGSFSFQPGEIAKLLLVVIFAGYLVLHRDALALAGRRVLFVDLPRGRDLGPILLMWLVSLGILVFETDLGSQPAVLRPLPDHAVRRRPSVPAGCSSAACCSSAARSSRTASSPRADARRHLAAPVRLLRRRPGGPASSWSSRMFGMGWGGLLGRGLGQGMPSASRAPSPTSSSAPSARSSA